MAKVKNIEFKSDVTVITMEANQLPVYSLNTTDKFVKWGKDNKFPNFIKDLFNYHPEHGAIVKGKTRYLCGTGITPSVDTPQTQNFLSKANRYDNWHSLSKKLNGDYALYGGFACMVETNFLGQPIRFTHVDMGKLRINNTLNGFVYCDDWSNIVNVNKKTFDYPLYKKGFIGTSIYFYKDHTVSVGKLDGLYPLPDYSSVMLDIDTDIEISNFFNSLVKNGFSAGHIITFFNGKLEAEAKAQVERAFKEKHTGTNNAGKVVLIYTHPDGKGSEVTNITPTGLAEQYEVLNKRNENKIIRGHNVPRALFKMETEGALGDRTVLDLSHELFLNEYVKPTQLPFLNFLKEMCLDSIGVDCDFTIEQISLIGKELPLDNANVINALNARDPNIVTNYIIEKFGLKVPVAEISQEAPVVKQLQEGANDSLKTLTGRQRGALDTIARKYNKQTLTEQQAILQLMPFGFTEENAKRYLGIESNNLLVQQSNHNKFIDWIKLNTVEIDEADEIVDVREYDQIQLDKDNHKDYVSKDGGNLVPKKSFIQGLIDSFRNKLKNKDEYDVELYTVYKYGLRPELSAKGEPILLDTSHQFCIDMVSATSGNKRLTFEAIDNLNNDFGDNAWDMRGGFWGKKNTCRHVWLGETRKKIIKK